jgi:mannose-1-phosphate guanylyltransferase/mannose-6-phosphate isomerase
MSDASSTVREERVFPVILSGGAGTRLWPLSRSLYPKQLQKLTSDRTMLQDTALRLHGETGTAPPIVVCNNDHRFAVADQLLQLRISPTALLLEPVGRNTAPAAAVAALLALRRNPDAILVLLPADHAIADVTGFRAAMRVAIAEAEQGRFVTFGVKPDKPHVGYGYIERGAVVSSDGVYTVERFKEKPDAETAKQYLASGRFLWNSGIFVFRADRYLAELEKLQPLVLSACRASLDSARRDLDFLRLDEANFVRSPNISIDYAVMEHVKDTVVIPIDIRWNDVGSWGALWEIGEKDEQGNVAAGDVIIQKSSGCYVRSEKALVTVLGVQDLVIVETGDSLLIAARDSAEDVKDIVAELKRRGREEEQSHSRHHRPWGFYETVDDGDRFQVKHLMVKPGAQLSLQMHHHRAEHWVVVSGTGRITRGEETMLLGPNESTYIPMGMTHRLENPGKLPLHIIEVQSGAYLGEDDIVRMDDVYNRSADEVK